MSKKYRDHGYLFMTYRMEKKGGIISWLRIGKPMKSINSAINLCKRQPNPSYVETYPGGRIVFDTLPSTR